MAEGFPDSGQPDDYTEEQLEELAGKDKAELTKNQKAAVARWKFKKSPAAAKARAEKAEGTSGAKMKGTATAEEEKPKEDPEVQKHRDQALTFPYVKELKDQLGDAVVDLSMQHTKPYVIVQPKAVPRVARYAKDVLGFDGLLDLTAADYPPERIEVVYNVYNYEKRQHLALKATVPREGEGCAVPTITDIYAGANWLEREVLDLFGVDFPGHPYPKRLLLPEGWVGHPLRKDYDLLKEQYIAMDEDGNDVVTFEEEGGW